MEGSIPSAIGRYSVESMLGAGAMGTVYLARDPQLERRVAVKTLKRLDLDPEHLETFLSRFRNEARAAARLHHPNIVQVYDVGEDATGGPFLVMEYVPGSSLKHHLRRSGAMPPDEVAQLADEMAAALSAAHAEGIIHRDLKPDNLLMTADGHVKLADFGVARIPDAALTREGQFLGTPCYAAPETIRAASYGPATDLFSMASVLYEAASGQRAFPGTDAVAVAHSVLHDDPPLPSDCPQGGDIPRAVDAVLMRGLSKDPARRYADADELADALRAAYEQSGLLEPQPATPKKKDPTGKVRVASLAPERPSSMVFYAVVLVALLAGVGLLVAFRAQRPTANAAGADPTSPLSPRPDPPARAQPTRPAAAVVEATPPPVPAVVDAGAPLTEPAAPEGPDPTSLTPHEREEIAKSALGRARRALRDDDTEAARAALIEAGRFDPGNPDIARMLGELPAGP